jgi:hypothetical protein
MSSVKTAFRSLAAIGAFVGAGIAFAAGTPKTVCTITVNSADEKETFRRYLPAGDYRFVELVEHGRKDWLASACEQKISCDALIISGHFDGGDEFYTDRFDVSESLSVEEMQRASCSESCPGVFANLKEVYLFGCNTLKPEARYTVSAEIVRALTRSGRSPADAAQLAASMGEQHAGSNRDRIRQIFRGVPVIYGFSSKAPLGRYAGPLLDKYFRMAPAGEIGSGKPSSRLLGLFAPVSMTVTSGLANSDPQASVRADACQFVDDRLSAPEKVAFLHDMLRRDMAEVRMDLAELERFVASMGPTKRIERKTHAAFQEIADDHAARDRYLEFARDADEASVRTRMMALAREIGWLTPAQEESEFLQMLADRVAHGAVGRPEVDLACNRATASATDPALLRLTAAVQKSRNVAQVATLACLGDREAHARMLHAMASANADDIAIVHDYLRRRPLTNPADMRAIASVIARMPASAGQVRALESLAQQRISDPETLRAIAGLFPLAGSLDLQRAVAGILIRSDHRLLGQAELARSLKQYRIKSPTGEDVIDALIRVLQASSG